jgi:hypothetical protein
MVLDHTKVDGIAHRHTRALLSKEFKNRSLNGYFFVRNDFIFKLKHSIQISSRKVISSLQEYMSSGIITTGIKAAAFTSILYIAFLRLNFPRCDDNMRIKNKPA